MNLNIVKLQIKLSAPCDPSSLPFLAGRGGVFEESLRSPDCPSATLFSREPSSDAELLKRHQKPALPYAFACTAFADIFTLTLFGPAVNSLPLMLNALKRIGALSRIAEIHVVDYQGHGTELCFDAEGNPLNLTILEAAELIDISASLYKCCREIRLDMLTPLRLLRDGRELARFEPGQFIRSMLRRLSSMIAYYGEGCDPDCFREMSLLASDVCMKNSAAALLPAGFQRGVMGSYCLSGSFEALAPWLALGSLMNLGKGATYGMGSFRLSSLY